MDKRIEVGLEDGFIKYGEISSISGPAMSGLWTIHFKDGSSIPIESGVGMRTLARVFGSIEALSSIEALRGKEIYYGENWGVMDWFIPAEMV